jgi:hypothetical protein
MKNISYVLLCLLSFNVFQAQNKLQKLENKSKNGFVLSIDKNMTDEDLKKDQIDAKEYDFEVTFSGVKRNDKKEITAIKITYKDKDGNSGNYNVDQSSAIDMIKLSKKYDFNGKGSISITTGNNDILANNFGWENLREMPFDNDFMQQLPNGFNLDNLKEKFQLQLNDNMDGNMKIFKFDGNDLENNPDLKLEEEKEENGIITKKYSDGKGSTIVIKEGKIEGKEDSGNKKQIKKEIRIESGKSFGTDNNDLEKLKEDLEKTKSDLEKLKNDLKETKKD